MRSGVGEREGGGAPSSDAAVVVCEQVRHPPEVAVEGADPLGAVEVGVPPQVAEGGVQQHGLVRLAAPVPLVELRDELLVTASVHRFSSRNSGLHDPLAAP